MRMRHDGGGATRLKFFPAGMNVAAKPCDYCKSAAALLFCRAEAAFMCIGCDAKVHGAAAAGEGVRLKHERVWMCEVCEHAPAAVTCKADAAALCVTCDRDIHSANPLASRHDRVAVVPFCDSVEYETNFFARKFEDSWTAAAKLPVDTPDLKAMELFFQDSEQFLDFDAGYQIPAPPYTDSIVPVQAAAPARSPDNRFEIDFTRSNINSYNNGGFTTPSLSHSVSSSSLDVGIVPDGSSLSETSYPFVRNLDPTASQVVGMDREARVLRYKEKRKNRKFEKTIRYASRKAYAETRPRIKGRFAKRTDSDSDTDRVFAVRFGVVPSF